MTTYPERRQQSQPALVKAELVSSDWRKPFTRKQKRWIIVGLVCFALFIVSTITGESQWKKDERRERRAEQEKQIRDGMEFNRKVQVEVEDMRIRREAFRRLR